MASNNKHTREYRIHYADNDGVVSQSFGGNVETAKSYFFTDDALTMWTETSDQIQWAITADGNGIKVTNAHENQNKKGDAWTTRKNSLSDANNFLQPNAHQTFSESDGTASDYPDAKNRNRYWKMTTSDDHLF